jgi:predicted transcriptional regulator
MNYPMTQQEKQAAYDTWFVAEVDKGLADLDTGHVMTDNEAAAAMEHFFAELAKENNKAA